MNIKQDGFQQEENDTFQILPSNEFLTLHTHNKSFLKNENKMSFKSPFTIFNNIQITLSPFQNKDFTPQPTQTTHNQKEKAFLKNKIEQKQQQENDFEPLKSILFKPQSNYHAINNLTPNLLEKVENFFPKKLKCIYNKFQQNLYFKNDLTIIIKNIQKYLKLELLNEIQGKFQQSESENDEIDQTKKQIKSISVIQNVNLNKKILQKNKQSQQFEFKRSIIQMNEIKSNKSSEIQFISNFESGNLHLVFKDKSIPHLYYLFLSNDINTHGFNQWYYFGVKAYSNKKYRFIIVNISKQFKYNKQMKLLTLKEGKWNRDTNFLLYKNKYQKYSGGNLLCLDFQYQFSNETNSTVFFAFSNPYTFTGLLNFLKTVKEKTFKTLNVTIQSLGKSELRNLLPVLKIEIIQNKKNITPTNFIVIIARQHAGETAASFICQSIIRFLTDQQNPALKSLLKKYKFIIIPMLNPDGVIHGNSRTNIKGYDMNRLWQINKTNELVSIETYSVNKFITNYLNNHNIQYMIDLHSHSKQFGTFIYTCEMNETIKMFNYFFAQKSQEFRYQKCRVSISAQKKTTFRGQAYHRLKIKNTLTLQTSFYGYEKLLTKSSKQKKLIPFTIQNFNNIALGMLFALDQVHKTRQKSEKTKQVLKLIQDFQMKILNRKFDFKYSKYQFEQSSDSDCFSQYLQVKQRQQNDLQVINMDIVTKQDSNKQILQKKINKSINLIQYNNSDQLKMSIADHDHKNKNTRKKIYSMRNSNYRYLSTEITDNNIQTIDNSDLLLKKYPHTQKQIDFRKTLRRSYRINSNSYDNIQLDNKCKIRKKNSQFLQENKNFIVYPTANDINLQSNNFKVLKDDLVKESSKAKSVKQPVKFLRRMGRNKIHSGSLADPHKRSIQNLSSTQYLCLRGLTLQRLNNILLK